MKGQRIEVACPGLPSYLDSQMSYFSEGAVWDHKKWLMAWWSSSYLGSAGMGREPPTPHDLRNHIQVHGPDSSNEGQMPQVVSGRLVHPSTHCFVCWDPLLGQGRSWESHLLNTENPTNATQIVGPGRGLGISGHQFPTEDGKSWF